MNDKVQIHKKDINQIKLVTGQEILANVLERRDDAFTLNYALDMVPAEFLEDDYTEDNKTYYILRPFISYTDSLENQIAVNPFAVVSANIPSDKVIEQYLKSIAQIQGLLIDDASSDSDTGNVVSFPGGPQFSTKD